jgi:hypothetical protein
MSLVRIERNIGQIERQAREMRHSLSLYESNPRKYEPQLDNLAQAALDAKRAAEIILRTIGASDEED